jgi:hypothetical protein
MPMTNVSCRQILSVDDRGDIRVVHRAHQPASIGVDDKPEPAHSKPVLWVHVVDVDRQVVLVAQVLEAREEPGGGFTATGVLETIDPALNESLTVARAALASAMPAAVVLEAIFPTEGRASGRIVRGHGGAEAAAALAAVNVICGWDETLDHYVDLAGDWFKVRMQHHDGVGWTADASAIVPPGGSPLGHPRE